MQTVTRLTRRGGARASTVLRRGACAPAAVAVAAVAAPVPAVLATRLRPLAYTCTRSVTARSILRSMSSSHESSSPSPLRVPWPTTSAQLDQLVEHARAAATTIDLSSSSPSTSLHPLTIVMEPTADDATSDTTTRLRARCDAIRRIYQDVHESHPHVPLDVVVVASPLPSPSSAPSAASTSTTTHLSISGVFDRLHAGHRAALACAVLTASFASPSHRLIVTVHPVACAPTDLTSAPSSSSLMPLLPELVQPLHVRVEAVRSFVSRIAPHAHISLQQASDASVLAVEFTTGADANTAAAHGTDALPDAAPIQLSRTFVPAFLAGHVNDPDLTADDTLCTMIAPHPCSSAAFRLDMLGRYVGFRSAAGARQQLLEGSVVQPRSNATAPSSSLSSSSSSSRSRPFVIGLTGGIASGKSHIARYLHELGAHAIDCDKIGHETYVTDSPCYHELVREFGSGILAPDRSIDRRKLGAVVFATPPAAAPAAVASPSPLQSPPVPSALARLNAIVWPHLERLLLARLAAYQPDDVVVVEAAVLIEAGWATGAATPDANAITPSLTSTQTSTQTSARLVCDEVWLCTIEPDEAIRRVMARNQLSFEAARARVALQLTNVQRLPYADVLLSSRFTTAVTQRIVAYAWEQLCVRRSSAPRHSP